jgi:isoquinoline 1-oxidoreductase subunit beta
MGVQVTGSSSSLTNSYEQMRRAGATARAMLVQAAAVAWGVPPAAVTVERGVLRHADSGREGRFGQFAEAASRLPVPADVPLKDKSAWRLIGRDDGLVRRPDSAAKTNGTARFTSDISEPGMLTVLVAHPPRFGARIAAFDATAARAVTGVVDVKQIPQGIAVYATGFWPAHKGREQLRITWDESGAERRGSEDIVAEYRALAQRPGTVAGAHGDADAAMRRAERVIEGSTYSPSWHTRRWSRSTATCVSTASARSRGSAASSSRAIRTRSPACWGSRPSGLRWRSCWRAAASGGARNPTAISPRSSQKSRRRSVPVGR